MSLREHDQLGGQMNEQTDNHIGRKMKEEERAMATQAVGGKYMLPRLALDKGDIRKIE